MWVLRHDVELRHTVRVHLIVGRIAENTWVAI
jgi:hypothetical protein